MRLFSTTYLRSRKIWAPGSRDATARDTVLTNEGGSRAGDYKVWRPQGPKRARRQQLPKRAWRPRWLWRHLEEGGCGCKGGTSETVPKRSASGA